VPSAATAPPASLLQDKSRLRTEAKRRRQALAVAQSPTLAGEKAAGNILAAFEFRPGSVVSAYWPMDSELDTRPLIRRLHEYGCCIGLPVITAKGEPLLFRRWVPGTRFVAGGFHTEVPSPDEPEVVPERLIVPLLAFDSAGFRLGYGGGFYDRTLARLRQSGPVAAIGFAYASQEVPMVPRAAYDQPLDWMATENFVRRVRPQE
jgi:5-formyltetrahydrofolate cyclo-ligase